MPELSKRIAEYKPQPDPMAQQRAQLELQLLQAQIANEQAKAAENTVDVEYKKAKTSTELAKSRNLEGKSDLDDLDFVNKESGVADANTEEQMKLAHGQDMQKKEFDRLANLDGKAIDGMMKDMNTTYPGV
jgi:hypothetical protein